jgi:hypothetical protein
MITTEVQTLEQAIELLAVRQRLKKAAAAHKEQAKHPTLAQELTQAKLVTRGRDVSLANGDVHKGNYALSAEKHKAEKAARHVPHPYRDLPEEAKPAKAREMLASKNWGLGASAGRRLALLFGVDNATMGGWLGIEVWAASEFNARYARKMTPKK